MNRKSMTRMLAGIATALLMFGVAQAKGGQGAHFGTPLKYQPLAPIGMSATVYDFDVTDILSMDEWGSPNNEVFALDVGAGSWITGVGWDVSLYADDPSWLSEMVVDATDSSQSVGVSLHPAVNDMFSGAGTYSSGGIVDLIGLGLDFHVGADGKLRLEFYEDYDDYPGEWDGIWESGTLSFQVVAVPEPSSYALMILGLAGIAAVARRRRH